METPNNTSWSNQSWSPQYWSLSMLMDDISALHNSQENCVMWPNYQNEVTASCATRLMNDFEQEEPRLILRLKIPKHLQK